MKKYLPALITLGVIIIGLAAFSIIGNTAKAPEANDAQATTTESAATTTAAGSGSPIGIGSPASTNIKKVIKAYANPAWDIRLRYDPEWTLTQSGELLTISSISADFMVGKDQPIGKPARVESTETTRTILGQAITVTRYENPNEKYEYYEYFTLRVNGTDYYFKIASIIDPNPKVEEFIGNIVRQ